MAGLGGACVCLCVMAVKGDDVLDVSGILLGKGWDTHCDDAMSPRQRCDAGADEAVDEAGHGGHRAHRVTSQEGFKSLLGHK